MAKTTYLSLGDVAFLLAEGELQTPLGTLFYFKPLKGDFHSVHKKLTKLL